MPAHPTLAATATRRPPAPDAAVRLLDDGVALHRAGRIPEAIGLYRAALARAPDNANAHNSLGAALLRQDDLEGAEASLRRALALRPGFPEALNNLGRVARADGRLAEATRHFDAALAARPGFAQALWNRATTRLLAGDMPGGWADFEARWALPEVGPPQVLPRPAWGGEPLAGRTILLQPEQGLGDTIQFARYAAVLSARGAAVVLGVQPELKRLMTTLPGTTAVVARGEPLPHFDCHLPLLSVPFVLRHGMTDLPCATPYMRAEPEVAARWRERIGAGPGLKVGLVWAGNPNHSNDANRSLPQGRLAPLLAVPGVRLFALQLGARRTDLAALPGVTDLGGGLTDFAETAGALSALDLLVTVDTSPAHLAGALGRPVWLLLPAEPDWRWMLGRGDSPWYPTMRLFRQQRRGDWTAPIQDVAAALRRCCRGAVPTA
jgi:Tetratricopeptide repeat/Glycosyltransferase family 9 (heptosyltransferase)